MAVIKRTPVGHNSSGSTSSETFSYTCTSGDILAIAISVYYSDNAVDPSSVTYAGTALTRIGGITYGDPTLNISLWKLDAPSSGANNVVITTSVQVDEINAVVRCFGGASGFGTPVSTTNANQTSINNTVTGTSSGSLIVDFLDIWATSSGSGFTPASGQTSDFEQNNLGGNQSQFSSSELSTGGSVGMGWSWTAPSDQHAGLVSVEVLEESGGSTTTIIDVKNYVNSYYDIIIQSSTSALIDTKNYINSHYDVFFSEGSSTQIDSISYQSSFYDINITTNSLILVDSKSYINSYYDISIYESATGLEYTTKIELKSSYSKLYDIGLKTLLKYNNDLLNVANELRVASSEEVSHPIYLVEILLKRIDGVLITIRLSSAGKKTFDDKIFGDNPYPSANVSSLTSKTVKISLDNSGQLYSFFAFSDKIPLKEQVLKIWSAYSDSDDIPINQARLSFNGYIDDISEISNKLIAFTGISQSISASWAPRIYCAPPLCNHLPKAGTKIGSLLLEPSRS
jgi:hypothetical protein